MRLSFAVAFLLVLPSCAAAQDPATQAAQQAAQQATQQSQQATMQAMHDTEEASRQASEANRRAMDEHIPSAVYPLVYSLPPKFSVKPGHYAGPITVRMTSSQRDATIYYTTDGWKPSTASQRYRGPITISQTTTLCAIAVLPESTRMLQSSAQYVIAGTTPSSPPDVPMDLVELPIRDGVPFLPSGTSIPLSFVDGVTSQNAMVGDHLTLALTRDLLVGNVLVAAKGAAATATVVQVNRSGMGGRARHVSGGTGWPEHQLRPDCAERQRHKGRRSQDP